MTDEKEIHPSYGIVQISRTSCNYNKKLFGSPLKHHHATINIRIKEGEVVKGERIYGYKDIIEIDLSETQFIQMITTLNQGSGTPCTIKFRKDIGLVSLPDNYKPEIEESQELLQMSSQRLQNKIRKLEKETTDILDRKTCNAKDRSELKESIRKAINSFNLEFQGKLPCVIQKFGEILEDLKVAQKADYMGWVNCVDCIDQE